LVKQGQTELQALELARKMAQDRYQAAFASAMQQAQASAEEIINQRKAYEAGNAAAGSGSGTLPVNPPAAHQSQCNSPQSAAGVVNVAPVQAHAHSRISTSFAGTGNGHQLALTQSRSYVSYGLERIFGFEKRICQR